MELLLHWHTTPSGMQAHYSTNNELPPGPGSGEDLGIPQYPQYEHPELLGAQSNVNTYSTPTPLPRPNDRRMAT